MAKDISKDIFAPSKNRTGVNFSKKRPVAEFEQNEAQQILRFQLGEVWLATYGAGPIGDALAVAPHPDPNTVVVNSGTFVLPDGWALVVPNDILVTGLTTPVAPRTDYVYLQYMEDEETAIDSPELIDTENSGWQPAETATRNRWEYTIEVSEGATPPAVPGKKVFLLGVLNRTAVAVIPSNEIEDRRAKYAAMYVRNGLKFRPHPTNPLQVVWDAGTVLVQNVPKAVTAGTFTASPSTIQYLYVGSAGTVQSALTLPHYDIVPCVKLESSPTTVSIAKDLRRFAPRGGAGGTSTGTVVEYLSLDNLSEGDVVYLATTDQVAKADRDTPAKTPGIGVVLGSAIVGGVAQVLVAGELENAGWSWTPGMKIYLGSNGALTQSPLAETDANKGKINQTLGVAVTATKILFMIDLDTDVVGEAETVDLVVKGVTELGDGNQDVIRQFGLLAELDTRTTEVTFDGFNRLSTVVEKDGLVTVRTITYNYVGAATDVDNTVEVVDGKTITTTYTYGPGTITKTKSVV